MALRMEKTRSILRRNRFLHDAALVCAADESAPPAAGLQPQNTPPPPRLGENAARRTISRPDPVAIAVSLYGLTRATKSLYTTRPVLSSSTRVSVLSAIARRRDAALRPRPRRTGRNRRHRRTAFYTTTDPLSPAVPPLTSPAPTPRSHRLVHLCGKSRFGLRRNTEDTEAEKYRLRIPYDIVIAL